MHRLTKVVLMLAGVALAGCVYSHPYDRYDSEYRDRPSHHHSHSEARRYEPSSDYWHDHDRREHRAYEQERRHERSEERNYYRR